MALVTVLRTLAAKWFTEDMVTRENGWKSETRELRREFNRLLIQLSASGQAGLITTAGVSSKGSSAAGAWKYTAGVASFKGVVKAVTAAETALTATSHDTAQNKESWYVLSVQADGTSKTITKGADQTIGTVVLPATPANEIALSYMQIVTNAAAGAFDATTDDLAVGTHVASIAWFDVPAVTTVNTP